MCGHSIVVLSGKSDIVATLQLTGFAMLRLLTLILPLLLVALPARAADLAATIAAVKPSIVGIGTSLPTRSPAVIFFGTGWVTGDGYSVITNAHVVSNAIKADQKESLGIVLAGDGNSITSARPPWWRLMPSTTWPTCGSAAARRCRR